MGEELPVALLDSLRQSLDGDFLGVADVDDFADRTIRVHEADESFNGVAHIAEAGEIAFRCRRC